MKTFFLGKELKSPVIIGSGPSVYDGDSAARLCRAGAGMAVTKTIRYEAWKSIPAHMTVSNGHSLVNCEGWSDLSLSQWITDELPKAKQQGAVVAASLGLSEDEVRYAAPLVEQAGADFIEVVSYDSSTLPDMVKAVKEQVSIPVIAKISPNGGSWLKDAMRCELNGADALTGFDSMGPAAVIDIETGSCALGQKNGWLSGAAIRPFAVYRLMELAKSVHIPLIGLGGVYSGRNAIELMMAGASLVGVVSAVILNGEEYIAKILKELKEWMQKHNYTDVQQLCGLAVEEKSGKRQTGSLQVNTVYCTKCGICSRVCCYGAIRCTDGVRYDAAKCRRCGLCISCCPKHCLKGF